MPQHHSTVTSIRHKPAAGPLPQELEDMCTALLDECVSFSERFASRSGLSAHQKAELEGSAMTLCSEAISAVRLRYLQLRRHSTGLSKKKVIA